MIGHLPEPPALGAVAVGQIYITGLGGQNLICGDHNVIIAWELFLQIGHKTNKTNNINFELH